MGIEAVGSSRAEVLEAMARGVATLTFGGIPATGQIKAKILVEGNDDVELLVNWLNEVVYLCEKKQMVPAAFHVESIDHGKLRANMDGELFDPRKHGVERQIKSVTYHQACCEATREGWYARVYVDL